MKVISKSSALQSHLQARLASLRPSTTLIVSSTEPNSKSRTGRNDSFTVGYEPASGSGRTIPQKVDQSVKQFHKKLETQVQQSQFTASLRFNLKTIPYTVASAFPTPSDISSGIELMKRTGVKNVIGVGSGAAIDLAKSLYYSAANAHSFSTATNSFDDNGDLILVPGTMGAVMAAVSNEALIFSSQEEALLPFQHFHHSANSNNKIYDNTSPLSASSNVTVALDQKMLAVPTWIARSSSDPKGTAYSDTQTKAGIATIVDAALASLVISIDAAAAIAPFVSSFASSDNDIKHEISLISNSINHALFCLQTLQSICSDKTNADSNSGIDVIAHHHAVQALLHSGQLLTYGFHSFNRKKRRRSIPLALSSAILPTHFPHGNWLTFTASLFPGLVYTLLNSPHEYGTLQSLLDSMANKQTEFTPCGKAIFDTAYATTISDKLLSIDKYNPPQMSDGTMNVEISEWAHKITCDTGVPSLANLAEGTPDVKKLVDMVDAHGALINCLDEDIHVLEKLLVSCLNR